VPVTPANGTRRSGAASTTAELSRRTILSIVAPTIAAATSLMSAISFRVELLMAPPVATNCQAYEPENPVCALSSEFTLPGERALGIAAEGQMRVWSRAGPKLLVPESRVDPMPIRLLVPAARAFNFFVPVPPLCARSHDGRNSYAWQAYDGLVNESFGESVQRARSARRWTQRDLAQRLSVGQQAVSNWERGRSSPPADVASQVAKLLQLDVDGPEERRDARQPHAAAATVNPPARPLSPSLPLQELPPDVFEQFSADLAHALYPSSQVHRYGGQGHTQAGIDVIVTYADGMSTAIQCKREQAFGPAKVKKAVAALTADVDRCFIFLTRIASPQARQEIAKHQPKWALWDIYDLSREVRSLQDRDAAVRIVDTYFPGWREPFLGVSSPGPWLTAEEFFRPFAKGSIYSHEWDLAGRASELADLSNFATDSEPHIAVIVGRGGIGKTRLLRAATDEFEMTRSATIRFLSTGVSVTPKDFEVLPPDQGLMVVIDDAHDRSDVGTLIAGIRRFRPSAKVLLSSRPYGLPQLHSDLRQVGVHPSEVPTWELGDLTIADAETLARGVLGPDLGQRVAPRLAALASDCPLLIVVGAALIARGDLTPDRLEASSDIRYEILRTFGDVVATAPGGDAELRREVLKLVAVLQPFRLDQPEFQAAAAAVIGRPYDQVVPYLRALQDSGVLLRRAQSVRIVPDLLGDVLLADAAIDGPSGTSTGYLERVCDTASGAPLAHAVVNAGRVDWQTRRPNENATSAVDILWSALTHEYEAGTTFVRLQTLQAVRQVAVFQPGHAIAMVHTALDVRAQASRSADSADVSEYEDVIFKIPAILHRAAYSLDHLAEAADLLWELAREDDRPPHQRPEHPMRLLTELAEYAVGKPAGFQDGMTSAVERWLRDDRVAEHRYSPFAVLEPVLATEFEQRRSDGLSLVLRGYPLNPEWARTHRDRVIDLALQEAREGNVRRAVRAVEALGSAIHYPRGMYGRQVSAEERARWTPAFVEALHHLTGLAGHPEVDPVVVVAVRQAVRWHARYSTTETRQAALAVLAALPDDIEHRLAHVLHDGWRPSNHDSDDYDTWQENKEIHFEEVADDVTGRWSPNEVIDHLDRRLALDRSAYGPTAANPIPFVWSLVRRHPEVGVMLLRRLISENTRAEPTASGSIDILRDLVPTALGVVAEFLPDEAMNLARALVDTPSVVDTRAVAHAFGWGRGRRTALLEGEPALLLGLIAHDDQEVRRLAVSAAGSIDGDQQLALQLVTNVQFADSPSVAAEVAALLTAPNAARWESLTDAEIDDLFDQLRQCPSIDDYHITTLLAELSAARPEQVLDLLLRRAETYEHHSSPTDYDAFPFHWDTPLRLQDSKDFERLLRRVVMWIAEAPQSLTRTQTGAEIFNAVAGPFEEQVSKALSDAANSGAGEQMLAVAAILGLAPRDFIWNNTEFVIACLRAADGLGNDYLAAILGGVHSALIRGTRIGTPGQPFPEDVEQRDKANEIASTLPRGSVEHQFYQSLASAAERQISREIGRDEELDDSRAW
jgi:transcriptional regulator with XRE-family HTH domain